MENRVGEPMRGPAAAQDHAPGPQPDPLYSGSADDTSGRDATRPGTPRAGTSSLGPSPVPTSPADTAGRDVVPPLDLTVHRPRSGRVLVVLRGALVAAAAPGLARTLAELAPRIALDLSGVTSIAPECLDALLRTEESLAAVGGSLVLLAPSPAVVLMLHEIA